MKINLKCWNRTHFISVATKGAGGAFVVDFADEHAGLPGLAADAAPRVVADRLPSLLLAPDQRHGVELVGEQRHEADGPDSVVDVHCGGKGIRHHRRSLIIINTIIIRVWRFPNRPPVIRQFVAN